MSAVVCGKRSFFEDLTSSPPSSSPGSKRLRCSSTSPVRFSAPTLVDRLRALFPYMDDQLLEKVLDECDNDLDAAIKRLHGLSLGYGLVNSGPPEEPNANVEKAVADGEADPSANHPSQQNPEMGGAEWVELFVQEMISATSIDDARSRATKVLESLEQSISIRAGVEAAQMYHKENVMLKEQIELLLHENSVLKRAVAIQHERQKEYDDKNQEVQHLKQLVTQYQEQMRTLEVNNYALTMHLQQAREEIMLFTATILVLALSLIFYIFANKSRKVNPPLPPGPKGLPILGSLPFLDPELHSYFAALGQQYGPIMTLRLGGTVGIVITSPVQAREVLKDHDVTFANRDVPVAGREATYGGVDIVWTPYGPTWRMLRKVCIREMLSPATLDSVYALRRTETRQMIRFLDSRAGSLVNVGEQMFLTVLNVITGMLWGGTVKGEARESLGGEFRQVVMKMTGLLGKPNLSDFFPGIAWFDLQGIERQMKDLATRFDKIFIAMIDQRSRLDAAGRGGENKDFLQVLLKLKDEKNSKTPFTMTHVKALLMDMVVGGTDTTSNTVEFALAEMMNKPQVMQKAQQELERVVGKNNIVEESHIQNLPYLYAIMKETLRLHPALPLLVPHCPSQTCVVGGYTIPKGARVFVNAWAIHRDPAIWENPLEFDPERFLVSKWDYNGNDFNYFPFGSGRRICAGTAMAERMFMYSLASLVHSFDWKLPEGGKLDLSEKFGIVLKKKDPLVAIPIRRLSDPTLYE